MTKRFGWLGLAVLLTWGCNPKYNPWRDYHSTRSNYVQAADIKAGEKLKKQHPDEEFVYNNYIMEIGFSKNPDYEEWQKHKNEKKKKYTKLKWNKDRRNYTVELNDEFSDSEVKKIKAEYEKRFLESYGQVDKEDFKSYLEEVKRGRNSTPPGQYMSSVKTSFEITSLEDFNRYPLIIPFSGGETVSGVNVDYGRGTFEPTHLISPYESRGYFSNDLQLYRASVYFPTVGTHSYIDYNVDYNDMKYNTSIYIPEDYFIEKKTITFAIPSWLDVTIVEKNMDSTMYSKNNSAPKALKRKKVNNQTEDGDGEAPVTGKNKPKPKDKKSKTAAGVRYITYTFKDVKPFDSKNDFNSRGHSYNYPHFLIQYNYASEGTEKKPLTGTLTGLYGWYHELVKQLKNDTAAIAAITNKLIEGKTSDDDKIKSIYYWVQDNIRYIAFEDGIAGFKPEECSAVYENRYGDCKGMANLLVNMLKLAGFDARHVWIGTRHLNYDYSTPSLVVDNHMIAAVKRDTGFLFLDGTENYCPLNQYAFRIQGREVLIEDGDSFVLKKLPEYNPEYNLTAGKVNMNIEGNLLKASVEKTFHGEGRLDFVRSINDLKLQDRESALYRYTSENNVSITPSNIKTSDIADRESPATLTYDLSIDNHIISSGDKKYISIDFENDLKSLDFDTTKRTDFDFGEKLCIKSETRLNIGSASVVHLPEMVMVDNEFYHVVLAVRQSGSELIYKREIISKKGYLPTSGLREWNEVSKKINQFYNDYIIIK